MRRRIPVLIGSAAVRAAVAGAAVVAALAYGAGPAAAASGPTLWVSSSTTVSGNGTSCSDPGFNTIQSAITAAPSGATIEVCAGTYTEQLQIASSVTINGVGNVIVQLPSTPADSTTACDTAQGTGAYQPDQDGIAVCGSATVKLDNIVVDAAWASSVCDDSLYGILVGGGATLSFDNSSVIAAGAYPLNGCQGGIGIQAGMSWTTPVEVGHLTMTDSSVSGYQKNGVVVDGAKSTGTISHSTVTGAGPTTAIAQNGIQVSNGAGAKISYTTVSGNECDDNAAPCGANGLTDTQSAGLLFYGAASGSSVSHSRLSYNDMGLYYSANPAGSVVRKPQVTCTDDNFIDNRYEGAVLDQGSAFITDSSFSRGNIGIEVIQYSGQTHGSYSVATYDKFSSIHDATVDVLSDRNAADKAGTFTVNHSQILEAKVLDNSKNLKLIRSHNTK
jgi:hypothetical protein